MDSTTLTHTAEKCLTGLPLVWGVPFVGVLLSLALGPLVMPKMWHDHFGKICSFWSTVIVVAFIHHLGVFDGTKEVGGVIVHHYIPFVLMVGGLYVMARGIGITVSCRPSPGVNTLFLGIAALMSSVMGTTGAAMVFIRPFLMLNHNRHSKTHLMIFFIFLVCNVGGSLTAVGDPPLFLGFLAGIPFFWSFLGLGPLFLMVFTYLLIGFFVLDYFYWRLDDRALTAKKIPLKISVTGWIHGALMIMAIGGMVVCGQIDFADSPFLSDLCRDLILLSCAGASFFIQKRAKDTEIQKEFWAPVQEIAYVFAAIFITAHPVLEMLKECPNGALGFLTPLVNDTQGHPIPALYFWVSGILSSFLDNAPTYLVFFELAGGDVSAFLSSKELILKAFSAGAVFMGAMTYIGNAPNFMVKSISELNGIPMPHFFRYMGWSVLWLLPIFFCVTFFFF